MTKQQIFCHYYHQNQCRSCTHLTVAYAQQLTNKQQSVEQTLAELPNRIDWLPIMPSAPVGFRNKAKMVVSGHWRSPQLGSVHSPDLIDCPLYPKALQATFEPIRSWICDHQLMPYHIQKRTGELKYIIISIDEHTEKLMLRLVLRSAQYIPKIRAALPSLQALLAQLTVISANIQPLPAAIIEGDEEIILTEQSVLTMWINGLPLYCQPRSFFQTNTSVAAALYQQAQKWIAELQPKSMWDLFCGVGGFALHAAQVMHGRVTGIEINPEAIASAQRTAQTLGLTQLTFRALSATDFALDHLDCPECILVNPPRRGIGEALCHRINHSKTQWLIYSSCNPQTLTEDLKRLSHFKPISAQVFDMFPHTQHAEVLILLQRNQETLP